MKLDSKYFDKIRIKTGPNKKEPPAPTMCEWPGCAKPSRHKAPKGRGFEGQFHNYCTQHVQEYNKTYNYFDGMKDDAVAGFQKDAQTGHRPTWKLGQNSYANINGMRRKARECERSLCHVHPKCRECRTPNWAAPCARMKSRRCNTLGLDETATAEKAKSQYKILVKRLHPDANGG